MNKNYQISYFLVTARFGMKGHIAKVQSSKTLCGLSDFEIVSELESYQEIEQFMKSESHLTCKRCLSKLYSTSYS